MKTNKNIHRNKLSQFVGMLMIFGLVIGVTSSDIFAQIPPANTSIGNTASATYLDSGNNLRPATSNTVITIVQQVAGIAITPGISKTVSPGNQIEFSHAITNTGNGNDNVTISAIDANTGNFNYTNIKIYADDGGAPDLSTQITTAQAIAAGTTLKIWIVADVPASAGDGDSEQLTITATSGVGSNPSVTATDTGTVEEDAVINVSKSVSSNAAEVGDTLIYTFTYSNTGNSAGTLLRIEDELPSQVTYITGSATWSGTASALTEAQGGDPSGISYEYKSTTSDSVIYIINNIPTGNSGTVSFKAKVNAGSEGETITNEGSFTHDDLTGWASTGQVVVTINELISVTAVYPSILADSVDQGSTVDILNRYVNQSTITDNYNISFSGSTFPSGTQVLFYQTNGSGVATSPYAANTITGIAPGDTIEVITRITLPIGATGGPFYLDKTITSQTDGSAYATIRDSLAGVFPASVDLTNNGDISTGVGVGVTPNGEATAQTTKSTLPANTVVFDLYVNNTSAISDNYILTYSKDNPFTAGTKPTGWTVVFKDPNNANNVITTTGSIASGSSKHVQAYVTVPAGYVVGTNAIYFKVASSTTGAADVKHDAVQVLQKQDISLTVSQQSTIFPGGSKTFVHTFTVNSNVVENDGVNSKFEVSLSNSTSGFTSLVYLDNNNNGTIDAADSLITSASGGAQEFPSNITTLGYGSTLHLIVKVTAPSGATVGSNNTTTLTVDDVVGTALPTLTNMDQVTVQTGVLTIDKTQTSDSLTVPYAITQLSSAPGDIVYYKLVVYNNGSGSITDIDIIDSTPSYTKQVDAASLEYSASDFAGTTGDMPPYVVSEPGNGGSGSITVHIDKLDASDDNVAIYFKVKINNL